MFIIKITDIKNEPCDIFLNIDDISYYRYDEKSDSTLITTRSNNIFMCEGNITTTLTRTITASFNTSVKVVR